MQVKTVAAAVAAAVAAGLAGGGSVHASAGGEANGGEAGTDEDQGGVNHDTGSERVCGGGGGGGGGAAGRVDGNYATVMPSRKNIAWSQTLTSTLRHEVEVHGKGSCIKFGDVTFRMVPLKAVRMPGGERARP